MDDKLTDDQLLKNIREQITLLQGDFVNHFDSFEQTMRSRLLRLFEEWKQVNLRRIVDLADAAYEMFHQERLVPACTLTRSVFETVGIQYYVNKKIIEHTIKPDPESIHKLLISAVFGRKDMDWSDKPIQILTAIDHMNKEFEGARSEFDRLCEYAHPNLYGGYGTYVRTNETTLETDFGNNPMNIEMGPWGLVSLHLILLIAAEVKNRLNAFVPQFTDMVNKHAPIDYYKRS